MAKAHTHYDNLRVTRDAPLEVIKAAYRALAQKHHPDVNKSPDSLRVMRIINEAWEVLGDPLKRAEHDAWIACEEGGEPSSPTPDSPHAQPESDSTGSDSRPPEPVKGHRYPPDGADVPASTVDRSRINRTLVVVVLGFALFVALAWNLLPSLADAPSQAANATPSTPPDVEPLINADQVLPVQSALGLPLPERAKPPRPAFASIDDRLIYLRWLGTASHHLIGAMPEHQTRIEFLGKRPAIPS